MSKKLSFVITLLCVASTMISCSQKSEEKEVNNASESASVEALGQMNRDFAAALTAKNAAAAASV